MPELQRLPLGQTMLPWRADPDGMSFYVYDTVTQRLSGRHARLRRRPRRRESDRDALRVGRPSWT